MCGIAGFVGQGNEDVLRKMTGTLKHRGPDDEGYFVDPSEGVFLGHRRLSIIDIAGGKQPIYNEDKSVCVIFNGEIYNFQELRKELEKRGHKFNTHSDTEVIVHSYEERGEDFIKDLNGMFGFALWDGRIKKLILARDRMGEKPLYYSLIEKTLIFGSEPKAILVHPKIKRELNLFSLAKYLNYEYVPSPETIYKGILKIGPGEYLTYQSGNLNRKTYWDIEFRDNKGISEEEVLHELDRRLEQSVRMRLVSDVSLGVWLSGGLDSTSITYYAQKNSDKPIKTFSIGFTDQSFDESRYARLAANFLKTDHYEKILTPKECLDLIPHIAEFLDEPFADASIIPTYLLSKFSREKVKVGLGGDGGDELFMGYPTFQAHKLAKFYEVIPQFLRNSFIEPLIRNLPASSRNISLDFKLKRFISGFEYRPEIRDQIWMGSFQPKYFSSIFSGGAYQEVKGKDIFSNINNYSDRVGKKSFENRLIYLYLKNYLQEDILMKTDRSSMAVGLEVRAPLLDYELVEFINSIPSNLKLRGLTTKYIFKKLMEGKIPKSIVYRPKKGFGIPIANWIRNDLKDFTVELLNSDKIKRENIFNPSFVSQLLKEHLSGRKDNRKLLWTLMVFEIWLEKWGK